MKSIVKSATAFVALTIIVFASAKALGHAWDADECWRLDRQNRQGYPVAVPEWCEPHGFKPRAPGAGL